MVTISFSIQGMPPISISIQGDTPDETAETFKAILDSLLELIHDESLSGAKIEELYQAIAANKQKLDTSLSVGDVP